MLPSTTPTTHNTAASHTTRARLNQTQARHPSHEYRVCHAKPLVDTGLSHACHACHVKRKWISPRGAPATHSARGVTRDQGARKPDPSAPPSAMSATPATQNDDVWNCAMPATRNDGGWEIGSRLSRETMMDARLGQRWWMRDWATPTTWNESECHQVPRETMVDVRLCHAWQSCVWVCVWSYCMLNLCVWSFGM